MVSYCFHIRSLIVQHAMYVAFVHAPLFDESANHFSHSCASVTARELPDGEDKASSLPGSINAVRRQSKFQTSLWQPVTGLAYPMNRAVGPLHTSQVNDTH